MISLVGAGKRFGPRELFDRVDWMITSRDRVGLVGANGTGKTTLLKMLAGMEQPDMGEVTRPKGLQAGYLPQDGLSLRGRTVFAECMSVFENLKSMEREMEELAHSMGELDPASEEYEFAADRYGRLDGQFRNRDGYALEAKVGAVLAGLGFVKEDWLRATEEFSGGWQMRIALGKLLLEQPDLLLLDEPTNHLDLEARNWLEEYLTNYPGAFVLISHDRYFLDVTVKKIAELWNRGVHFYSGNYAQYLKQKDERRATLSASHKNQQDRIEQLEAFITRFRYKASKAKQVQSRIKELEKIERIEIPAEERVVRFEFSEPPRSGDDVVVMNALAKQWPLPDGGVKPVFSGVSGIIKRQSKIAVVGVNGAGKSTFLKVLAGQTEPSSGTVSLGANVELGYFSQHAMEVLDPKKSIFETVQDALPLANRGVIMNLLGAFLFSGDAVDKKIENLSGGEKSRVVLATLLARPINFLVLDEPTNHLDIRSREMLLNALQNFTGTVMLVSHDRHFLRCLVDRVIEVDHGEMRTYEGNYEYYLEKSHHFAHH